MLWVHSECRFALLILSYGPVSWNFQVVPMSFGDNHSLWTEAYLFLSCMCHKYSPLHCGLTIPPEPCIFSLEFVVQLVMLPAGKLLECTLLTTCFNTFTYLWSPSLTHLLSRSASVSLSWPMLLLVLLMHSWPFHSPPCQVITPATVSTLACIILFLFALDPFFSLTWFEPQCSLY